MQITRQPVARSRALLPGLLLLALIIGGCGGGGGSGGGGGNITLTTDDQGADPVVVEIPVAYIRRPLPDEPTDLRDPLAFNPGAQLYVRERSATTADEVDVTAQIAAIVGEEEGVPPDQVAIDIKGLESSFDGKTLVFAARAVAEPVAANLRDSSWNLWAFDLQTMLAHYVIPSRIKRDEGVEAGGGHDIAPHFLPDDRIVFSSTRQVASKARQLNEGRIQLFAALDEDRRNPAAVLHLYDPQLRGAEFKQISYNLSHDLDPIVLGSGEIVFSRWNNTATDHISLYRIEPSGLALSPLYGFHSQRSGTGGAPVEFTQPRELDDGRLVSVARSFAAKTFGGAIIIIDANGYVELDQPVQGNQGGAGEGHKALTDTEVRTDGLLSRGGQFGSVYPLRDGTQRLLVTWSDCRVIDSDFRGVEPGPDDYLPCTLQPENTNAAPPLYGAWIYDPVADTQRPVVIAEEGYLISEIIAAEPRDYAGLVPQSPDFDSNLALENKGRLLIDSVYDMDGSDSSPQGISRHAEPGTPAHSNRPARFLRVVQPVPIPDSEVYDIPAYAFGVSSAFSFREILGYVPIEPDGSVTVKIPAGRPFTFSVLDARGRRIGARHNYWLQLSAGEVLHCSGCHSTDHSLPHGRLDAQPVSSNPGARALAVGTMGFPRTDVDQLFATQLGESMAQVWDFHRPRGNAMAADRELSLTPVYIDEWHEPAVTPDAQITGRDYNPLFSDITPDRAIVVDDLDPGQPSRIVINYIDHIQPVWERLRAPVADGSGNLVENCVGCHNTGGDTAVPPGQLDLDSAPSDIDPDHYRSYRELLSPDPEQWISAAGALADRERVCTEVDEQGNTVTSIETLPVAASMEAGAANGSQGFFACFEGGACGPNGQPPLPANCTEGGGKIVRPSANTIDHRGMLDPAELHLISEWLDIGAQYYNNPFDARLAD